METCDRCGRIVHREWNGNEAEFCFVENGEVCRAVRAAYLRGLRRGVEVAKENATIEDFDPGGRRVERHVRWDDVDVKVEEVSNG